MVYFIPSGTVCDTVLKEMQVSWRTSEAILRRCSVARGTSVVARQTVSQLCPISHLPRAVCAGGTLAHTSAVLKVTQLLVSNQLQSKLQRAESSLSGFAFQVLLPQKMWVNQIILSIYYLNAGSLRSKAEMRFKGTLND